MSPDSQGLFNSFLPLCLVFSQPCSVKPCGKESTQRQKREVVQVYHISSLHVLPPFVSFLPLCPSSLIVLPPFVSFLPSCPLMRQSLCFSTYSEISSPLLGQSMVPLPLLPPFVSFLPLCPPSLCVLPPFVSFLPSCPSSLHVH